MIRKLTMAAAAAALAFGTAYAQPGMQSGMHGMQGAQQMQQKQMHGKKDRKSKKGMKSVFLIRHGLPHYTMILMKMWDDPKLALTPEQKAKLETIRGNTMKQVQEIAPQVKALRKKIVQASKSGAKPETLSADVDELAALKAKATKVQLRCIYETRQVLTPEQIAFIEKHIRQKRKNHKRKKRGGHGHAVNR
jgi:Spy/CpxP family protein refolding chaperone